MCCMCRGLLSAYWPLSCKSDNLPTESAEISALGSSGAGLWMSCCSLSDILWRKVGSHCLPKVTSPFTTGSLITKPSHGALEYLKAKGSFPGSTGLEDVPSSTHFSWHPSEQQVVYEHFIISSCFPLNKSFCSSINYCLPNFIDTFLVVVVGG